jgi:hypothetical protein
MRFQCFQAGVLCGSKCKCENCSNYSGSQSLIDKRRKIKDVSGAQYAMQISEENWKGKASITPASGSRHPTPSPSLSHQGGSGHGSHLRLPPRLMAPTCPPPPYMGHSRPNMGYTSMSTPTHHNTSSVHHRSNYVSAKRSPNLSIDPSSKPLQFITSEDNQGEEDVLNTHNELSHSMDVRGQNQPIEYASKDFKPPRENLFDEGIKSKDIRVSGSDAGQKSDFKDDIQSEHESSCVETPSEKITYELDVDDRETNRSFIDDLENIGGKSGKQEHIPSKDEDSVALQWPREIDNIERTSGELRSVGEQTPASKSVLGGNDASIKPTVVFETGTPVDTGAVKSPRMSGVRRGYDPSSSKKKRKLIHGEKEKTFAFFGTMPKQPKTTALAIMSYLSNDEIYNARLVSKTWSKLAMDEELWQFN